MLGKAISCNRLLSNKSSCVPYFIKNIETTTFSTNEPFLLVKLTCSKLLERCDGIFKTLKEVPTEITIVQLRNAIDSERDAILYKKKANLLSQIPTCIQLSRPILIKPGRRYEIRLKQNPPHKCCTAALLKSEVRIGSDIVIQFHDDSRVEGDTVARGTILNLVFKLI